MATDTTPKVTRPKLTAADLERLVEALDALIPEPPEELITWGKDAGKMRAGSWHKDRYGMTFPPGVPDEERQALRDLHARWGPYATLRERMAHPQAGNPRRFR